jgi:hypothetical protein
VLKKSLNYEDFSVRNSSLTRCIVQLELVDKVSCILFGRNAFRVEGPVKRPISVNNHNDSYSPSPASEDLTAYSVSIEILNKKILK